MNIHEMGMVNIKQNQSDECNQMIHQKKEKKETRIDDNDSNKMLGFLFYFFTLGSLIRMNRDKLWHLHYNILKVSSSSGNNRK